MNIWIEAFTRLKQAEKTRQLWSNPLSIYQPDPVRLAAVMFNESRKEQTRDVKKSIEELRNKLRSVS